MLDERHLGGVGCKLLFVQVGAVEVLGVAHVVAPGLRTPLEHLQVGLLLRHADALQFSESTLRTGNAPSVLSH